MTATEMVHRGLQLVFQQSSTLPDSPIASAVDTLNDEQDGELASAIAAMKMPATTSDAQYDCCCGRLSGSTASSQVELQRTKRFFDIQGLLCAKADEVRTTESPARASHCYFCYYMSGMPISEQEREGQSAKQFDISKSPNMAPGPPPRSGTVDEARPRQPPARTQELGFKTVNEVWDSKAGVYKAVRSIASTQPADEDDNYVFVVRGRVDKKTRETTFHIDIKSERLRDVLHNILEDAYAISTKENRLSVERNLLYHYLPQLESSRNWNDIQAPDDEGANHVGLLVDYIKEAYTDTTKSLKSLLGSGEITYDLLWVLFKPNELVFTTCHGTHKPRCVKFDFGEEKTTNSGSRYWNIEGRYLDYDGKEFGSVPIELRIPKFRGTKRINLLEAFPLQHHPSRTDVRAELVENGRKFARLIGSHYRQYKGTAFYMDKGQPVEFNVDSRVMIDAEFFQKINPNYSRRKITEPADVIVKFELWDAVLYDDDDDESSSEASGPAARRDFETAEMTEDDFLICCPTVLGFSFADKRWAEFAIADIAEIQWSSDAFDSLVISNDDRELIMAVVEARAGHICKGSDFDFDDVVAGKGRGLNILLHGNPGLGKTLTAEAVSEHLKRPLYSISAGELNTSAAILEGQLGQIFQIAKHWGAVLLLDEADVYLERRSNQDLVRNSLVSVFLRKLEYCEGIMFLTTNRVSQFDEAVLSRIHLTLRYDDLNKATREQIWRQFLCRARTCHGPAEVRRSELEGLAATKFNGRQIKNIVATAHALAKRQGSRVQFEHIQRAVSINEKFVREFYGQDYVDSVYK